MVAIDPRAFALHKAWLSTKGDRDHLKRRRDMEQAEALAHIAVKSRPWCRGSAGGYGASRDC
jgi:hypothetical protein